VFTATLPTAYGKDAGTASDGTLTVKPGAAVRAVYHDAVTSKGDAQDRTAPTTVTGEGIRHPFADGRQMIAVPARLYNPNVESALGINGGDRKIATYQPGS